MKNILSILICVISLTASPQVKKPVVIRDTDLRYIDTIKSKVYIGECEPTGMIAYKNDELLISTIFSFTPELYSPDVKTFETNFNLFEPYWNTSSGSIYMIDKSLNKIWAITLKDQRVKKIIKYDDTTLIACGERADEKCIWAARIRMFDGKLIWFKEIKAKREPGVKDFCINNKGEINILTSSHRLRVIQIYKRYGRLHFKLFQAPENNSEKLMLLTLDCNGIIRWTKSLPIKTGDDVFDETVSADTMVSVFTDKSFYAKENGRKKNFFQDMNFVYDPIRKKLNVSNIDFPNAYLGDIQGRFFANNSGNVLILEKYDGNGKKLFKQKIVSAIHYTSLGAIAKFNDQYYIFGHTDIRKMAILKLDTNFKVLDAWEYTTRMMVSDIKVIKSTNSHIIVAGRCRSEETTDRESYNYINLMEFDLN